MAWDVRRVTGLLGEPRSIAGFFLVSECENVNSICVWLIPVERDIAAVTKGN